MSFPKNPKEQVTFYLKKFPSFFSIIFVLVSLFIIFAFSTYASGNQVKVEQSSKISIKSYTSKKTIPKKITPIKEEIISKIKKITLTVTPIPTIVQNISLITPVPIQNFQTGLTTTTTKSPTSVPTLAPVSAPNSSINSSSFTAQEIFNALNKYRQSKGIRILSWDPFLANFAQGRAEQFARDGKMDEHAGFRPFMASELGVHYSRMGENSGYGHKCSATDLIEKSYASSFGHEQNQTNPLYKVVGIGVSGSASDLIFGTSK